MRISSYIPVCIRTLLENQTPTIPSNSNVKNVPIVLPIVQTVNTIVMFADVSGFTAMTESLAAKGPVGAECLGKYLNSYFEQMLKLISSAGGDVFKFAGDAMIVFWTPKHCENNFNNNFNLNNNVEEEELILRAIQCALRIQDHLHAAELAPGVVLRVKMGIGKGPINILHLGGVYDGCTTRMEYIAGNYYSTYNGIWY